MRRLTAAMASLAMFNVYGGSGCATGRDFREAALPLVESGVSDVVNGLVDGFFAAIAVETPNVRP